MIFKIARIATTARMDSNSQAGIYTLFSHLGATFDFGKMLLFAFRANSVRYSRLTKAGLSTHHVATPGAELYYYSQLPPI